MDIFEQQPLWLHVIIPLLVVGVVLLWLIAGLLVARRRKKLRLWHLELAAILMLGFLVYLYLRGGPPGSPQRVARNFLAAIEAFDCDTAWQYFSSQSQRAIQIASNKKKNDPFMAHVQRRYLEPKKSVLFAYR
jgi:hypothetical protein